MKKKRHLPIGLSLAAVTLLGLIVWLLSPIDNAVDLSDNRYYIAHAGGAYEGRKYTNSREAVMQSLAQGYQFIELDLHPQQDGSLLCLHWPEDTIGHTYTLLTLSEALDIRSCQPFVLVTDKIDDPDILNRYFADNKQHLRVEAFSWQQYVKLQEQGYFPMLGIDKMKLLDYIRICLKSKQRIQWVTSSAYSQCDILKLRVLKKLFGVKIAFVPIKEPAEYYKSYIGNEFDLIYVDDKTTIQSAQ